jgi:hypothetical protein
MKKTVYIELTPQKGSIFDLSEKDQEIRIENAWKELREKTLAMGIPFLVTEDTAELPNGQIVALSDLLYPNLQ